MRERRLRLILTFPTTQAAMAAERCLKEAGGCGRLIPVPEAIHAGCGLAWSAPSEERAALFQALGDAGIPWESANELVL